MSGATPTERIEEMLGWYLSGTQRTPRLDDLLFALPYAKLGAMVAEKRRFLRCNLDETPAPRIPQPVIKKDVRCGCPTCEIAAAAEKVSATTNSTEIGGPDE